MKKRMGSFLLAVFMVLCLLPTAVMAADTADTAAITMTQATRGNGEAETPYQIGTAEELYWFANEINENSKTTICAVLTADIVVNTGVLKADGTLASDTSTFVPWTPIRGTTYARYSGIFDGRGHTISGLYYYGASDKYVGLFGRLGTGTIKNVGILDSYFYSGMYTSGICGWNNDGGTIENCYNAGTVNGSMHVGGVCGATTGGTITDCYNTGNVIGSSNTGGICGMNQGGTISSCYNTGSVNSKGSIGGVGGVCGYNDSITKNSTIISTGTIVGCYNTGTVSAPNASYVGGVCGELHGSSTLVGCYNAGNVTGKSKTGSVCGDASGGTVTGCCYLENTAGNSIGYGSGDAVSKTKDEFRDGTVLTYLNDALAAAGYYVRYTQDYYPGLPAKTLQGEDGKTPQLKIGEDNIWYVSYDDGANWESLGVKATGDTGATPKLKIGEDNFWYVSYDDGATWTSLGVKATGDKGDTGDKGEKGDTGDTGAAGADGADGADGVTPKLKIGEGNLWYVSYDDGATWTSLGVTATGEKGDTGDKGEKGDTGDTGAAGADGADGKTPQLKIGEDNFWYVSYDDGATWTSLGVKATGDKGEKGDTGDTGAAGADGADGADGVTPKLKIGEDNFWYVSYDDGATWTSLGVKATGDKGDTGDKGEKGDTGDTGAAGADGADGANGVTPKLKIGEDNFWYVSYDDGATWTSLGVKATGDKGNTGDKGEKGDTGDTGATGADGADGADGKTPQLKIGEDNFWYVSYDDGATWTSLGVKATGEKGDTGATGEKGDKGDTGATGEKGDKGDKGDTGATGAAGKDGVDGKDGKDGADGKDGNTPKLKIGEDNIWYVSYDDGATWESLGVKATGDTGATGEKGDKGDTGATGATGEKGDKGDTGATGEKGDKGDTGAIGATGAKGDKGADGQDGLTPTIGANGNWWLGNTDTGVKATPDAVVSPVSPVTAAVIATVAAVLLLGNLALMLVALLKKNRG